MITCAIQQQKDVDLGHDPVIPSEHALSLSETHGLNVALMEGMQRVGKIYTRYVHDKPNSPMRDVAISRLKFWRKYIDALNVELTKRKDKKIEREERRKYRDSQPTFTPEEVAPILDKKLAAFHKLASDPNYLRHQLKQSVEIENLKRAVVRHLKAVDSIRLQITNIQTKYKLDSE
jgi:hypothetical protein